MLVFLVILLLVGLCRLVFRLVLFWLVKVLNR